MSKDGNKGYPWQTQQENVPCYSLPVSFTIFPYSGKILTGRCYVLWMSSVILSPNPYNQALVKTGHCDLTAVMTAQRWSLITIPLTFRYITLPWDIDNFVCLCLWGTFLYSPVFSSAPSDYFQIVLFCEKKTCSVFTDNANDRSQCLVILTWLTKKKPFIAGADAEAV